MGYAKYHEDDQEIVLRRIESKHPPVSIQYEAPSVECPYCKAVFPDRKDLSRHIKTKHNVTHPVIIINGKVANDDRFSCARIEEVSIFTYGFADKVSLNGKSFPCNDSEKMNLSREASELLESDNVLTICAGSRRVCVNKYTSKDIRKEKTIPIIRLWEEQTANGAVISFDLPQGINDSETEFLKGFFNYFVACVSEGENKQDRYYEAYTILRGINPINSLGLCALKVIAFMFNWIETLRNLCNRNYDDFSQVCDFYDGKNTEPLKAIVIENQNAFFVEDNVRECLDAIVSFMFGEYSAVEKYLSKNDIDSVSDPNLKDRLLVISRELALHSNENGKAVSYDKLVLSDQLRKNLKRVR